MNRFVFDIETDGLLDQCTRIHSLVLKNLDTNEVLSFCNDPERPETLANLEEIGLPLLAGADMIAGHNIIKFDIPAIKTLYPWWEPLGQIRDTLVWARIVFPSDVLRDKDFNSRKTTGIPNKLIASHSLKAWGYRLTEYKGDYDGPWDHWSQDMQDYCVQDCEVTAKLFRRLVKRSQAQERDGLPAIPENTIDLEHRVATIVARQERYGILYDRDKADRLVHKLLARRAELESQLQQVFPPRWRPESGQKDQVKIGKTTYACFRPKRDNKRMGYTADAPLTKAVLTPFNPGSRVHIAEWLIKQRGWKPEEYTSTGIPQVDETILSQLPWDEAKLLAEYFTIGKRLGQIEEGDQAWHKYIDPDGRIRGGVNTNGAVTTRMSHSHPNLAQVPGTRSPYGQECRELFIVPEGKRLVGCDADGLELRCLGGYMARYDDGAYIRAVLEGDKEAGTDNHSMNCRALGMDPKAKYEIDGKTPKGRDISKTWFYAFIYGAGLWKLGHTYGFRGSVNKTKAKGKEAKTKFLAGLPALGRLAKAVKSKAKSQGFIRTLDGRKLIIRHQHAALNTLLQSAGALLMKQALVILDDDLQAEGFVPGVNYEFVANVHDEWQIETDEDIADHVGQIAKQAIVKAGEAFRFRCPLDGDYSVGLNWADTH